MSVDQTPELDHRIAIHEASHCVVGRALGAEIGGVTIVANGKFAGRVWGPGGDQFLSDGSDICGEVMHELMPFWPGIGEPRDDAAEFQVHAMRRTVELLAGSEGEAMLEDAPLLGAVDDNKQALRFARLVCVSSAAVEAFLSYAKAEARALLEEHRSLVLALADCLLEKRTLTGAGVDAVLAAALARSNLETEHRRRLEWARVAERARLSVVTPGQP